MTNFTSDTEKISHLSKCYIYNCDATLESTFNI